MLVLENAYEKIIRGEECALKRLGATIIRGENVVLVGVVNGMKAEDQDRNLRKAEYNRLRDEDRAEWAVFEEKARKRGGQAASTCGFEDTFY